MQQSCSLIMSRSCHSRIPDLELCKGAKVLQLMHGWESCLQTGNGATDMRSSSD
jgi:hypothetical protein